jgi:hypothetical protein
MITGVCRSEAFKPREHGFKRQREIPAGTRFVGPGGKP